MLFAFGSMDKHGKVPDRHLQLHRTSRITDYLALRSAIPGRGTHCLYTGRCLMPIPIASFPRAMMTDSTLAQQAQHIVCLRQHG